MPDELGTFEDGSTTQKRPRGRAGSVKRTVIVGVLITAGLALWILWTAQEITPAFEAHGSFLVSGAALEPAASQAADGGDADAPTVTPQTLAFELLQDPLASPAETWGASTVAFDARPTLGGLLQLQVQALSVEEADELLDDVLGNARSQVGSSAVVVVFHRPPPVSLPTGTAASSAAIVGVFPEGDMVVDMLRPDEEYLARVAGVVVNNAETRERLGLGTDEEITIAQTRYDAAPVVDLTVAGNSPSEALERFDRVGEELSTIMHRVQESQDVSAYVRTDLVPLHRPYEATLQGSGVLSPFFHAAAIVCVLLGLIAWGLERLARGPTRRPPKPEALTGDVVTEPLFSETSRAS